MKIITLLILALIISSCKTEKVQEETVRVPQQTTKAPEVVKELPLTKVDGDLFIEYYPNSTKIKFKGPNDSEGKRHGKWLHFSETGLELSMSMYKHGVLHGHSMVKYPNGKMHYIGQYENGERAGEWSFYDHNGVKTNQNFDK